MTISWSKKLVAAAVGATIMLGAGAVAWADSGAPTGAAPATAAPGSGAAGATPGRGAAGTGAKAARQQLGAAMLRRADHGDLEVRVGPAKSATWRTITFDRGTVSAVSATSITIARPDGQSVTLVVAPTTKFRGGATSWQDVHTAAKAVVISDAGTATQVLVPKARAATAAGPNA